MKLPDPPNEEQSPEAQADETPKEAEQPKGHPRFGFYRETMKNQPTEVGKKPASKVGGQSAPRPWSKKLAKAISHPKADLPEALPPPEPITQPEIQQEGLVQGPGMDMPARPMDENNPGRRLHAFEEAAKEAPPAKIPWIYRLRPTGETTHRAYWDVASTLSLIVNIILVAVLLVMAFQIKNLKTTVNGLTGLGNNALGGLYANFVKMDQASINTTISVDSQIPINLSVPVTQNTTVVLTSNVNIPNAHVVINTGGLAINSVASVTLPAGTSLPIALNLTIPIQSTIPISLQVPVNIPLNQTELHQPFTGLQTTIRPLYCMLNKNAQYPEGTFLCAPQNAAPTGTP
jgi:hypothetical protein